ncbi:MAG: GGDEF domain-containing response regulator [Magnetococcales bacterium]|nr:GGDEF domain-containing response regulator [Magnetococcales bacterium]
MNRILVVDDEEEEILVPLLRQLGRVFGNENIKGATSAVSALEYAESEQFAVVVTDLVMPDMDGLDFCRAFRANPINLGYVIMLSGGDGGIAKGLQAGADVYFRKPYNIDDLVAQIEKGLDVTRNRVCLSKDSLTGLYMRRIFEAVFSLEIAKLQRKASPLSVILFDIDHFKQVNDTFGHHAGDEVLRETADLLKKYRRKSDMFVRFGGEEFLLLLPGALEGKAMEIASRLRGALVEHRFPEVGRVTASFGVATTIRNPRQLISRADHALYLAKRSGRDCVVLAEAESEGGGAGWKTEEPQRR